MSAEKGWNTFWIYFYSLCFVLNAGVLINAKSTWLILSAAFLAAHSLVQFANLYKEEK